MAETIANRDSSVARVRKSNLEVSTVDKITVAGYRACNTIAKIGITIDFFTPLFSVFPEKLIF
jgi:DNA-binding transcriptional regulator WhiA